jgi:hypothetical protein
VGIGIQSLLTIVANLETGSGLRDSNSSQSGPHLPQRPPAAIQEYMYARSLIRAFVIVIIYYLLLFGCHTRSLYDERRPTINFCFSSILSTLDKTCGQLTLLHSSKQAQGTARTQQTPREKY